MRPSSNLVTPRPPKAGELISAHRITKASKIIKLAGEDKRWVEVSDEMKFQMDIPKNLSRRLKLGRAGQTVTVIYRKNRLYFDNDRHVQLSRLNLPVSMHYIGVAAATA